jgi:recombination protein RecT
VEGKREMSETALTPYKVIEGKLIENKDRMLALASRHIEFEKTFESVLLKVAQDPKLQQCSASSIVLSTMNMMEVGLSCAGTKGLAYLVPFWNNKKKCLECQYIPGYRGLIDIAKRSGVVTNIMSHPVYVNDYFSLAYGTNQELIHRPEIIGDPGEMIGCYAIAFFKDGVEQFHFMTMVQLDNIRDKTKSKNKAGDIVGPWVSDTVEMYRKIPIRNLFKYLPSSDELDRVLEIDNESYAIGEADDATPEEKKPLADIVTDIADGIEDADYEDVVDELPTETEKPQPSQESTWEKPKLDPLPETGSGDLFVN